MSEYHRHPAKNTHENALRGALAPENGHAQVNPIEDDPLFREWTKADVEQSISASFEKQVRIHGMRPAVSCKGRTLSYGELNLRANQVAHAMLGCAGDRPAAVALFMSYDILTPAAMLGALKIGHFYVHMAPDNPEDRNAFILGDTGAEILLTDGKNLSAAQRLAERAGRLVEIINIEETRAFPKANPRVKVSAYDRCFIVYTSGSRGRPKGVNQLHRNILHLTAWYTNHARIGPMDRMSLLHSPGFIAGATACHAALLNGAALLPFNVREEGISGLADWVESERVSCLHAVPTLFRRLCQHLERERRRFKEVRLVRLGGEAVTQTEWGMWRERFPEHCRLLVGLGSAEALNIRQEVYGREIDLSDNVIPTGGPIPDIDVEVLDESGNPAGIGEVGEIIVRSEYLFSGYWDRPELTERVLGADPLDARRRVFRTGDLGRFTPDGRLFHVGRADLQAKVNGHRVEVCEVEQALRQLEPIRDVAVIPVTLASGSARLVAFAAIGGEEAPCRRELRAALQAILPDYMMPAAYVFMDELPLLPNGKTDRCALAERARSNIGHAEYIEPRDHMEQTMAEIWQRALGVPSVGIHDDLFLHLGGDSLVAVDILSEVNDIFHRRLPLNALYEANTIAELCRHLVDAGWRPPESGRLSLHTEAPKAPIFAVCGVFGHALRLLLIGKALGPNRPFYGLQPPGMDWESAGCATIESMAAYYVGQIHDIQPRGPYHLLGTSFGGAMVFEMAVQLQREGETLGLLAMVDSNPPDCIVSGGIDRTSRRGWEVEKQTDDPLVAKGIRVARVHRKALDSYLLRDRFRGEIIYFWCTEQTTASAEPDRRRLWSLFASEGMRIISVPGGHGSFHREPQFSAVVDGLRQCLD